MSQRGAACSVCYNRCFGVEYGFRNKVTRQVSCSALGRCRRGPWLCRGFPLPSAGGRAERAGVREGDFLSAIDGRPLEPGTGLEEVSAALRGPAGTEVTLTLVSAETDEAPRDVTMVRETIPLPSVTGYLLPDDRTIGILAVTSFSERTPDELAGGYADLLARGASKIILDLRGNSGGLLDSGLAVSRYFLESGVVLMERGRGGSDEVYRAERAGEAADVPLAVLVDATSASAAEIVAG